MTPRVSIVLPLYNAAATLPACLASIAAQTMSDYELVAVDDGSSDESVQLVAAAAAHDQRIRLLRNGRQGLVAALNAGLAASRAALVARMDGDDLMRPERLAHQVAYLDAHPATALVACHVALFPAELVRDGYREYIAWQARIATAAQLAANIYVESPFAHPAVMFRRAIVTDLGGYRAGDFPEDYELWLRMFAAGHPLARTNEVLLDWREHPERTSRRDPRYARAAFDRLRARYLAADPRLHSPRPLVIWGSGRNTRQRVKLLLAYGFRPTAWLDIDPDKVGRPIDGLPVHHPTWLVAQCAPRPFVLVYVNNHGARSLIDAWLAEWGYQPGTDYLGVG